MNPKHRRQANTSPPDEGPPTDELFLPLPPAPRPTKAGLAARVLHRLRPLRERGRSRTVAIFAVLGVVLIVVAVVGYRAMTNTDDAGDSAAVGRQLTYQARSTGKSVIVTYTRGANDVDGQATAASPWSLATTVTSRVAVLTVNSASDPNRTDSVSCAILDTATGTTLVSNTASPAENSSVTCVTGNLRA